MTTNGFQPVQRGKTVQTIARPAPAHSLSGAPAWPALPAHLWQTGAARQADLISQIIQEARFMMQRSNDATPGASVGKPYGSIRLAFTRPG